MSFSNRVIKNLSTYYRNFKVGTLNYIMNSENDYSYNDFICLLYLSVTDNLIKYFKDKKIEILLYGIPHHVKIKDYGLKLIIDNDHLNKINS